MSATSVTMSESALQARLREKLNMENIKLWTEPFFNSITTTVIDTEIIALACRYATELKVDESKTIDCLLSLQSHALERLAERELLNTTGVSTLRLKLSGFSPAVQGNERSIDKIQMNIAAATGKELRRHIADMVSFEENRLKLICAGKIIKDDFLLELQNVKNGSQIMVLCVGGGGGGPNRDEEQFRELEETRGAADYLAGLENGGDYSLNVENQDGKLLDLPPAEKKALGLALVLHEKGRSAMKTNDFSRALLFLLEADTAYSECQARILQHADNYGMLNLDIAWCYLMLQSISELPAVETRLGKCETALHRSYGENMERVIALKGSTGWETGLFVRLHLLQGIASYHLGHFEKAKFFITKVEKEIERLKVQDNQLADLINLGYSQDESTMALRITYGNIESAVNYILQKREEMEIAKKQEREERIRKKLQKRLGQTEHGQPLNVSMLQNMVEMGYHALLASSALKRANNEINDALQLVTDPFFISSVISDRQSTSVVKSKSTTSTSSINTSPSTSTTAMQSQNNSSVTPETSDTPLPEVSRLPPISPSLDMLLNLAGVSNVDEDIQSAAETEQAKHAYENISKDINSESSYIDLTLSVENQYFQQYKNLLNM